MSAMTTVARPTPKWSLPVTRYSGYSGYTCGWKLRVDSKEDRLRST